MHVKTMRHSTVPPICSMHHDKAILLLYCFHYLFHRFVTVLLCVMRYLLPVIEGHNNTLVAGIRPSEGPA